jgi:hypothetical protein
MNDTVYALLKRQIGGCRYNAFDPGPGFAGTSYSLSSMIQKIEIVVKKVWYAGLVIDNKCYLMQI